MRNLFRLYLTIILATACLQGLSAQGPTTVSGRVTDEKGEPFPYVNIYIEGTVCGTTTEEDGTFSFRYDGTEGTLCASMIGYEDFKTRLNPGQNYLIKLQPASSVLNQSVVVGSTFLLRGNSTWDKMEATDLVTGGAFMGNLATTIQSLPGAQASAESGTLRVRGGSDRENQVYIDGMRVLFPYTVSAEGTQKRLRFSPFIFEGINFSSGGYSSEYADALSGVLPMDTKDKSEITKSGINIANTGAGGGGTKAFRNGSVSFNADYIDLGWYGTFFPDNTDWIEPYRNLSTGLQWRAQTSPTGTLKSFTLYDFTHLVQATGDGRRMKIQENNIFSNLTYKDTDIRGWNVFAGAAVSARLRDYAEVLEAGDMYDENEGELHLKLRASKRIARHFRVSFGVEDMVHKYEDRYRFMDIDASSPLDFNYASANASLVWNPKSNLFIEMSGRGEYRTGSDRFSINPRLAVNYEAGPWKLSAIAGRYTQTPEIKWMLKDKALDDESCMHYVLGAHYSRNRHLFRAEAYYKDYDSMVLLENGLPTMEGNGFAKGLDFYYMGPAAKNLDLTFSYTWGLAGRRNGENPEMRVPDYFTRHNAYAMARYYLSPLRTIIAVTDRFASGRAGVAKPYNSLDLGITFLINPKLLVYTSVTNVTARKNNFGTLDGKKAIVNNDRSIYIGVYITLSGNTAYDVSNF